MKTFKQGNRSFIAVEVMDYEEFTIYWIEGFKHACNELGSRCIGLCPDISEEQAKGMVEPHCLSSGCYCNYLNNTPFNLSCITAKESLETRLQVFGMDFNKTLIIEQLKP